MTPRNINQWELPWKLSAISKTQHHPTSSSTQFRTPHPNNKHERTQTQSLADRLPINTSKHHLTQRCPSNVKTKQNSAAPTRMNAQILHITNPRQATRPTLPLGAETKSKRNYNTTTWRKETSNTASQIKWRQTYCADEGRRKKSTRPNKWRGNKLPEEFRVMIACMIQNLEIRVEKMQELFNSNHLNTFKKDLKEIKYKQWWTTQLLKLKIL